MSEAFDRVVSALQNGKMAGGQWIARCPAHEDKHASLAVRDAEDRVLVTCYAGCSYGEVMRALGLDEGDGFDKEDDGLDSATGSDPEAVYRYTDERGELLFEVCRLPGKRFLQRRADGAWGIGGVRRVLFQLPAVLSGIRDTRWIWVCEGEKDALAVTEAGGIGTCNPMGAGKWSDEYSTFLLGAHVRIVADKDKAGRDHADMVATSLEGKAATVEVVEAAYGKDAYDHLAAGFTLEDFVERQHGVTPVHRILTTVHTSPLEVPRAVGAFDTRFYAGRLYILGGYTGEGKTSLALQHAVEAAEKGAKVLYCTLEMPMREIAKRAGMIALNRTQETINLQEAAIWFGNIRMDVREATTTEEIEQFVRRYDLVVVDHIHHAVYSDRMSLASRAKTIHHWARLYNLPVLALVQLTEQRGQGNAGFGRPSMSAIRDAADISHVGDLVQLIYRPRDENGVRGGVTELLTVKDRYGPEGMEHLFFNGATHRFDRDVAYQEVAL